MPGPRGLPLLGSVAEFAAMPRGQPRIHALWHRLARAHGPLYRVSVPGKTFVVVTDPALLPAVLGRPGLPKTPMYRITRPLFCRPPPRGTGRAHADNMFTVLSCADPGWSAARKAFACNVSPANVEARFPGVLAVTRRCAAAVADAVASGGGSGGDGRSASLDVQDVSIRLALDMILGAAYGVDVRAGADLSVPCALLDAFHSAFQSIYKNLANPFRRPAFALFPWLPAAKRDVAAHATMYEFWARLVGVTRAAAPPSPDDTSYLACLNRLRDPVNGGPYSTAALTSQIGATVIAGTDTTAHAAAWALYSLAAHPAAQARLAEELDAAGLLASPSRPRPRLPSYADLGAGRLPFLEAVIAESMRLWPVGGAGIGRFVDDPAGVELAGFWLPPGTEVAAPLFALHRSPWAWERPDEFDPGRWLSEEGKEGEAPRAPSLIRAGWPAGEPVHHGPGGTAPPATTKAEAGPFLPGKAALPPSTASEVASHSWSARDAAAFATPAGETVTQAWVRGGLAAAATAARPVARESYLPYAGGPRECLGRRFAAMELATALVVLAGAFEWSVDAERMGGARGVEEREVSRFTLAVEGGLWLRAAPRAGGAGVGWAE
jgi:cytochrome P450